MSFINILYTVILYPITQIIEISFKIFQKLFDNPGISVIGVSIVVTLLCLPLYIVAEHWQQVERDTQSKLKKGIDRIKTTFSGDEQYMILSTYYKQNHYHPIMALRSSFGLLIQIPFFMAAYSCLSKMQGLQGQSFLFIRDMGQQDALFYIGNFPVNILPIAMTLINIIAGAIYTKGFELKDKLQIYGMALVFLVILYSSPSGLVLYWTMNNVFSLVKNIFYKLKNPLKVLYYLMCACIGLMDIYILFIYSGAASITKRLAACSAMTILIAIPLFLKLINWLLNKPLKQLMEDKKLRNILFIFSAIGITILCGLVLPSNLISSSTSEFSDIDNFTSPTIFLSYSFWQCFGLFVIWPVCIYFLFKDKVQSIISVLFSLIFICGLFNAFAFKGNYSSMDVTLKFIDGFKNPSSIYMLLNLIVVALIIFIINFIILKNKTKIINSISLVITISLIVLSVINISKIKKDYKQVVAIKQSNEKADEDFKSIFHVSKNGQNVILFMLDRAESSYFEDILKDFPELNNLLSGFTYYKNTASFNHHTLMGSPALYGGFDYTPAEMNKRNDISLKEKHNQALLLIPTLLRDNLNFESNLSDLAWANYDFYSDMSFVDGIDKINGYKLKGRYTADFKKEYSNTIKINNLSDGICRNLFWVSLFKIVPSPLRSVVYYDGSWWATESTNDLDSLIDQYAILNYLKDITKIEENGNYYCAINNETTHSNEPIKELNILDFSRVSYPELKAYPTNCVSLLTIGDFFNYLKENDCYDNTKIVIVADHAIGTTPKALDGYNTPFLVDDYEKDHLNPLLLVKDFNSTGDIVIDNSFMTNADVPSIIFKDLIENPVNPNTGNPINQDYKKDGITVTIDDLFMAHNTKDPNKFTVKEDSWYKIKNNLFDDSCWEKVR